MTVAQALQNRIGIGSDENVWLVSESTQPLRIDQINDGGAIDTFRAGLGRFDAVAKRRHSNLEIGDGKELRVRRMILHQRNLLVASVLIEPLEDHEDYDPDQLQYFTSEYDVSTTSYEAAPSLASPQETQIVRAVLDLGKAALLQQPAPKAA